MLRCLLLLLLIAGLGLPLTGSGLFESRPSTALHAARPPSHSASPPSSGSALQTEAGRRTNPAVEPPRRVIQLGNGVRTILVPFSTDDRVTIRLVVDGGTGGERASEAGIAEVAARWMKVASRDRTPGAISLDVDVTAHAMSFTADVVPSAAGSALRRMERLVRTAVSGMASPDDSAPSTPALDRAKASAIQSVGPPSLQADARHHLRKRLFRETGYGHPSPTREQISQYVLPDVRSFIDRHVHPKRVRLYVVGRFPSDAVAQEAGTALGTWTRATSPPSRPPSSLAPQDSLVIVDQAGASESVIALGAPVVGPSHEDHPALTVASMMIGGSHASQLARSQDFDPTSPPYSQIIAFRDAAYWSAIGSIRPTQTRPALQSMQAAIRTLAESDPAPDALDAAQSMLVRRFLMQSSTRDGLTDQMMYLDRHDLDINYFMQYESRIRAVSPEDVRRVTARYLAPERLTTVIVGPRRLIEPQLGASRRLP